MKKLWTSVLLLLFATAALGQTTAQTKRDTNLQPLDWLTRGTWTAEFKTPEGKPFIIQSEIRWAATGTAIHFLTRFNNEPHYFGIYAYDPVKKQLRFFYSSSDGQLTEGHSVPRQSGMDQFFSISSEKGTTRYTSTIERSGEDAYDFQVFAEGNTTPLVTVHYVRK